MKLAGAKSILRLSRHWDHMIPIDLFYLMLKTSEVKSMPSILGAKRNNIIQQIVIQYLLVLPIHLLWLYCVLIFIMDLILSVLSPDKIDRLNYVLKLFLLTFRLIFPKLRDNF